MPSSFKRTSVQLTERFVPHYFRLESHLRETIRSGALKPGEAIPPESQLSQRFGVSRTTVRQTLSRLVYKNLIIRQRNHDNFVAKPPLKHTKIFLSFEEEMQTQNAKPSIKLLEIQTETADKKVAKKLADNPLEQVRLSWGDMYEMRKELSKLLSEKYGVYNVNVVINAVGEFMFSNFEYFSPLIALSGPAGFVVLTGLPIGEETFQCNISVRNILIKGGLSAATKLVMKVPIIKSDNVAGVFADKFIKSATTAEASKWVKHFFGDGLEVQSVSVVKQYGKEFALITVKSALGTGQHYSNK